jgi:hypothetical protein
MSCFYKNVGVNGRKPCVIFQQFQIDFYYLCNMKAIKDIETKINKLSPGLIGELDRYLDYLVNKKVSHKHRGLKQNWAGDLKDIKMSSLELQKKALNWRQK